MWALRWAQAAHSNAQHIPQSAAEAGCRTAGSVHACIWARAPLYGAANHAKGHIDARIHARVCMLWQLKASSGAQSPSRAVATHARTQAAAQRHGCTAGRCRFPAHQHLLRVHVAWCMWHPVPPGAEPARAELELDGRGWGAGTLSTGPWQAGPNDTWWAAAMATATPQQPQCGENG